ncbi:hypothetical protein Pla52nx_001027 [Stieleria varia]|uniref:hypothetical protein n=1 Tax=Stieleria varia TaxID=2528005 RepID=UPI00313F325C
MTIRTGLGQSLSQPITSLVDGQSFRGALTSIAAANGVNLWVQRKVDPTAPVYPGQLTPTVWAALETIAAQRDCVVMAIQDVVLVGHASWVDTMTARLLQQRTAAPTVDVQWDDLTTPTQALIEVTATASDPLPHDLWPANRWVGIDRGIAVALIRGQFEIPTQVDATAQWTRRYESGPWADAVREAAKQADPKSMVRVRDGWMIVRCNVLAHRAITSAILGRALGRPPGADAQVVPVMDDDRKFSLKLINKPASAVLTQLAGAAGRPCTITASAATNCETLVNLEAEEKTLVELVEMVAQQANVQAQWTVTELIVTAKP